MKKYKFHGFPVVQDEELVGYVTRDKLRTSIKIMYSREPASSPMWRCTFSPRSPTADNHLENLSDILEVTVLQLRKELPQELVVNMFQKLVRNCVQLEGYNINVLL